jgi:hypothetical protein
MSRIFPHSPVSGTLRQITQHGVPLTLYFRTHSGNKILWSFNSGMGFISASIKVKGASPLFSLMYDAML